jgi:hypothetical protein
MTDQSQPVVDDTSALAEPDDFEKHFNEFAAGGPPLGDPDPDAPVEDDAPDEEAPVEDDVVDDDAPVDDEAPVEDEAPDEEAPIDPEAVQTSDVDAVRRERDQLRHRLASDDGRVSALQRKINELETRLQQSGPEGPAPEDAKEVAQLKEDYPELAGAVQQMLDAGYKRIRNEVQREMEPIRQEAAARTEREIDQAHRFAEDQLTQAHPGWRETAQSEPFLQWLVSQPTGLQQMYYSADAKDAVYVLDAYQRPPAPAPGNTGRADEVEERRQRKLASSQSVASRRSVLPTNEAPEDFEGAFEWYKEQEKKKQARQ